MTWGLMLGSFDCHWLDDILKDTRFWSCMRRGKTLSLLLLEKSSFNVIQCLRTLTLRGRRYSKDEAAVLHLLRQIVLLCSCSQCRLFRLLMLALLILKEQFHTLAIR